MNIKKALAAAGLAAFLTTGCAASRRHNLTPTPGNIQCGLDFPRGVSGQVYVEGYRGDLRKLALRIEGFASVDNPNYEVPVEVICPLSQPFYLKLGQRCYLENGDGLVEMFWQIEKNERDVPEVILYMNFEGGHNHSAINVLDYM